jgi:hypothetical protein
MLIERRNRIDRKERRERIYSLQNKFHVGPFLSSPEEKKRVNV